MLQGPQGSQGPSKWTVEIEETVRANYALGVTAAQCSALVYERYGVMFSRNAVIGKACRMGWPTIRKPCDQTGATGNTYYVQKVKAAKKQLRQRPLVKDYDCERPWQMLTKAPKHAPHVASAGEPASRNVPLLKLKDADCRFPTSEEAQTGRHLFCGHVKQDGSSYCAFHHDVCNGRAA